MENFSQILAKQRCHKTDIEVQSIHNVQLKLSLRISKTNLR